MPSTLGFSALMFVAGIGIPVLAALNAGLGARLANPNGAVFVLFIVGLVAAALALAFSGLPSRTALQAVPWYFYLGGLLVAFYVLSVTWAAPIIGVGNAVLLVLFGQLIAAALIDHFGLFDANRTPVDGQRLIGLLLIALGVYLTRRI